jgi:excisionase family DNA binding protein
LTARELAETTGLKVDWILDQWQAGELPGYRLTSRAVRFRESEVEAWLTTKREGPKITPTRELRSVR